MNVTFRTLVSHRLCLLPQVHALQSLHATWFIANARSVVQYKLAVLWSLEYERELLILPMTFKASMGLY